MICLCRHVSWKITESGVTLKVSVSVSTQWVWIFHSQLWKQNLKDIKKSSTCFCFSSKGCYNQKTAFIKTCFVSTVYFWNLVFSAFLQSDVSFLKSLNNRSFFVWFISWIIYKTRNTLTQASKNDRKPHLFPQKKCVSVFNAINIFNTIYYFKPTNFNCA